MTGIVLAAAAAVALAASALGLKACLARHYIVVTVQGASMAPTYRHGERVVVRRRPGRQVTTDQVALVDLPETIRPIPPGVSAEDSLRNRRVIKRIAAVAGDPRPPSIEADDPVVPAGHIVLLGDNPLASGDSRQFGYVPVEAVVGVVLRPLGSPGAPRPAPR
jgi:signal peptidase I